MKKIGIIFGMETTFPPALVDKINSMGEPGIQAELAQIGEVRMAEPSPYHVIVDRISHDIPFYRGYLKNAALSGTIVINNPFWWSADDKFFNFALGRQAGRGDSQNRAAAAQGASGRHHRSLHAQPAISPALGQHLQLRRISRVPEALRWRRLARRVQGELAGGVLRCLRSDARSLHDPAARREVQGIFPLLRGRAGEGAHHAVRSFGAHSTSAT